MTNEVKENTPLLNAIGLKKYYPVKKGLFAKSQQVKALDGVSFQLERGKTLARRGIWLWKINARAFANHD